MTKETQKLVELYEKVDDRGRILMWAVIIILSEGKEEEKTRLNDLMDETKRQAVIDEIYDKYYPIVQERLANGTIT